MRLFKKVTEKMLRKHKSSRSIIVLGVSVAYSYGDELFTCSADL